MKNLKPVLAVLAALCLLLCLTVPVFATGDLTAATTDPTTATTDVTTPDATGDNDAQPGAQEEEDDIKLPVDPDAVEIIDETTEATEPAVEDTHDHDHSDETAEKPSVLRVILIVLEVIASIALIIVVLVQSGKESGLSGTLAGNSDSYMSKGNRATLDKKLATMTKWVALAWVALTLLLSLV